MEYTDFGMFIKFLKKKHHYSQEKVAEKIGVTSRHYSRIEKNEVEPTISVLYKLEKIYYTKVIDYYINLSFKDRYYYKCLFLKLINAIDEKNRLNLRNIIAEIESKQCFKQKYDQLYLFTKSIIDIWNEDYTSAQDKLQKSLSFSSKKIILNKLEDEFYNIIETLSILYISICDYFITNKPDSIIYTINYFYDNAPNDSIIYEKIILFYLNTFLINKSYIEGEKFTFNILEEFESNNSLKNIYKLHFFIGIFKQYNGDKLSKMHFNNSLTLLKIFNKKYLLVYYQSLSEKINDEKLSDTVKFIF